MHRVFTYVTKFPGNSSSSRDFCCYACCLLYNEQCTINIRIIFNVTMNSNQCSSMIWAIFKLNRTGVESFPVIASESNFATIGCPCLGPAGNFKEERLNSRRFTVLVFPGDFKFQKISRCCRNIDTSHLRCRHKLKYHHRQRTTANKL